jgi:tRNA (Thr-GGU) A37 N-methylase
MQKIEIVPIGYVKNSISETGNPASRELASEIILSDSLPANAFDNIEFFSHVEIIFYFDLHGKAADETISEKKAEENKLQPAKNYGSKLFGTSIVRLIKVSEKIISVSGLDAINGTIVIDIKPVMSEFLPKDEIKQPEWSKKISGNY